jgi:hypothetical protein
MFVADIGTYSGKDCAVIPASYSTEDELCALIQEGIDDVKNGNVISGEAMMRKLIGYAEN